MAEIIMDISAECEINIQVNGIKGTSCLKETEGLEKDLGITENREKTAEYNQRAEGETRGRTTVNNRSGR